MSGVGGTEFSLAWAISATVVVAVWVLICRRFGEDIEP